MSSLITSRSSAKGKCGEENKIESTMESSGLAPDEVVLRLLEVIEENIVPATT